MTAAAHRQGTTPAWRKTHRRDDPWVVISASRHVLVGVRPGVVLVGAADGLSRESCSPSQFDVSVRDLHHLHLLRAHLFRIFLCILRFLVACCAVFGLLVAPRTASFGLLTGTVCLLLNEFFCAEEGAGGGGGGNLNRRERAEHERARCMLARMHACTHREEEVEDEAGCLIECAYHLPSWPWPWPWAWEPWRGRSEGRCVACSLPAREGGEKGEEGPIFKQERCGDEIIHRSKLDRSSGCCAWEGMLPVCAQLCCCCAGSGCCCCAGSGAAAALRTPSSRISDQAVAAAMIKQQQHAPLPD